MWPSAKHRSQGQGLAKEETEEQESFSLWVWLTYPASQKEHGKGPEEDKLPFLS